MAVGVRSRKILDGTSVGEGNIATYTVPEGRTLIVKSASVFNNGAGSANSTLYYSSGGDVFLDYRAVPSNTGFQLELWAVLNAGDELIYFVNTADVSINISGTLLIGVSA